MGKPLWRRGIDTIDALVGPVLGEVVNHDAFGLTMALLTQTRRVVGDRGERLSRQLLHLANLPAGSDVTRLLTRLASIEREVRELSHAVNEARLDEHRFAADQLRERDHDAAANPELGDRPRRP